MKKFLQELIAFINDIYTNDTVDFNQNSNKSVILKERYLKIKNKIGYINLEKFMYEEFKDDKKLYIFILSIIFKVTKDINILLSVYDYLLKDDFEVVSYLLAIRTQLIYEEFVNETRQKSYELFQRKQKLNDKIISILNNYKDDKYEYRSFENRNKDNIVIFVNQMLGENHAPTRVIGEICNELKKMGKRVLVVVEVDDYEYSTLEGEWLNPILMGYTEEMDGFTTASYANWDIDILQLHMKDENVKEVVKYLRSIVYDFNPMFVWHMGGFSLTAEIMKDFVTTVGTLFSKDLSHTKSTLLARYVRESDISIIEDNLKRERQCILEFNIPYDPKINKKYNPEEFGIEKEKFTVLVIGNRLDYEINNTFIELMKKILSIDEKIHFVFIGNFSLYEDFLIENPEFKLKTNNLGYREDLVDVVSIGKLFLNPPRKGAAAGAVCAMKHGIPVLTLPDCDISALVESKFISKNNEDMYLKVKEYFESQDKYNEDSDYIREKSNRSNISLKTEIQNLLIEIEKNIKEKEVIFQ